MISRSIVRILSFSLAGMFVLPEIVAACPTCKDGLHDSQAAWAFGVSILFMMSMPFFIFACWFVAFTRWQKMKKSVVGLTG